MCGNQVMPNKQKILPPSCGRSELKFSESNYLPIVHLMTKFSPRYDLFENFQKASGQPKYKSYTL